MQKKVVLIGLVAILAVLAVTGVSLAYFTDNEESVNTFTMGNVDITLSESAWVAPETAVPAVAYAKNPVVTNDGDNAAWIRVDVTLSDATAYLAAMSKYHLDSSAIFTFASDFDRKWKMAGEPAISGETVTLSFYYEGMLAKGANTGALFTAVTFPKQFNNADMASLGDDFTVTVTAHAMQDAGFADAAAAFAEYAVELKE